jgi:hypothetical protein
MTNYYGYLYSFISLALLLVAQPVCSQGYTKLLAEADSLFEHHQYAQSFDRYKKILDSGQQYSPQMLLKMAYLQEAQRNYTATIYYLHLFYDKRPNRATLKKMEDLAQQQNFLGYEYSDLEFFQTQLQKYFFLILQMMLMVAVAVLTAVLAVYWKRKKLPGFNFQVIFLAYLGFILFYTNYFRFGRKGIIRQNNVAIMAAPAAGAPWITTATEGHRIDLNGERDIWYEIEWNGHRAYIRKKNVLELP